jgi:peptidoglycan/LPS O-acetylase OafA/YrhL
MVRFAELGPAWLLATWSLAVEEQFYLGLPLMVFFLSSRRLPYVLGCFILAAPLLRLALFYRHNTWGYLLTPCRADALLLGVLCAYGMRQQRFRHYIADHRFLLYGFFVLSLIGVGVFIHKGWSIGSFAMNFYGYSLMAVLYSCFLLIAITERRGLVTMIVRNGLMVRLGVLAYGVYLFHQPIHGLTYELLLKRSPQIYGWADVIVTATALLITLIIAKLSWVYFEKPLVTIGHSFKYRKARVDITPNLLQKTIQTESSPEPTS